MKKKAIVLVLIQLLFQQVKADGQYIYSPEAARRTYAQNYKDMVLGICLANAYKESKGAAIDVGSSVSALRDWTYYDMEKSIDEINNLVSSYLARNYHNPLVETEVKDVQFNYLKCMDLYHSKELEEQVKKFVIYPNRTYRQDNASDKKPK